MARRLEIPIFGNITDLESALERAGIVADDASRKISGSFRSAGLAAAQESAKIGASLDEQAAAAGRAAAAFTEMSAKITTAQRNAGKAAAAAASAAGASVDEQRAAYSKAIAVQSDYEAAQKSATDAAKTAADEQVAASRRVAEAAKASAAEQAKAAATVAAARDKAMGRGSKTLESLGRNALLGGAAVVGGSVYGGVKLQQQMERLRTQAGATQAQVGSETTGVLNMAGSVGMGPEQLSQGMYHVVSSLNKTTPAAQRVSTELNVLKIAAEGAKVGGSDMVDTTNALDAAIVSGIKGVQNYSQAMGTMNATVGAGDMSMQDLADAFGTGVVVQAKLAGVSINQLGGSLAVLGDNNIRGARAGTLMASALRIMKAPSEAATQALNSVGLSSSSLASALRSGGVVGALQDLKTHLADAGASVTGTSAQMNRAGLIITRAFGGRQSSGIQDLISQLGRLKASTKDVADGGKNFGQDYVAWSKTLAGQFDKLEATVEALGDKFGLYLIPKLEATGQAIESVIGWLQKHQAAAEALAAVIGGVLGAAVAAYAYSKAVAFVNATQAMFSGIGKLAIGVGKAAAAVAAKLGIIGASSEAEAAEMSTANAEMVASSEAMEAGVVAAADGAAVGTDAALGATGIGLILVGAGIAATELATHWHAVMSGLGTAAHAAESVVQSALNDGVIPAIDGVIHAINDLIKAYDKLPLLPNIGTIGNLGKVHLTGGGGGGGSVLSATSVNAATGASSSAAVGVPSLTSGSTVSQSGAAQYAVSLLQSMGIKATPADINALVGWIQREGNDPSIDKNNPLDTTMSGYGGVSTNSVGVKSYGSAKQGLAATIATLKQQNFAAILASLKAGTGLSGPGVTGELNSWSGGGYTSAPSAHLPTAALKKYLSQTGSSSTSTAAATSSIPVAVATMLQTAQSLLGTKYTWGGGHSGWDPISELKKIGIDCSGFVSRVLHAGGVSLPGPQDTEGLASNLQKGKGKLVTVFDRHTGPQDEQHTLIDILGHYFMAGGGQNPNGGRVSMLTQQEAAKELQGGGFQAFHPKYSGKLATEKQIKAMGLSGISGSATTAASSLASLQQAIDSLRKSAAQAGLSLMSRLSSDAQNGSSTSLQRVLGWGGGWGGWQGPWKGYSHYSSMASQMTNHPSEAVAAVQSMGNNDSIAQVLKRLLPGVKHETRGTAANTEYQQKVEALIATGQDKEAKQLVAAHERAMKALAETMYAEQVTKNAETMDLENTQLQDQTSAIQNAASNAEQILSAQSQKITDDWDAATTRIKDAAQIMSDTMQGVAQAIKDQTTLMGDQSGGIVDAINDQTQIQVDQIGERGLYGLNLIAQQQTVQLDVMKAGYDQQIDTAQQQLDELTASADAAENSAQLNLDQVTVSQDSLVSMAQNHLDTVTIAQDQRIATAQAHADAVQLHADATIVGPAQTAVDMGATLPKSQQNVLNAQLAAATAKSGKLTDLAQQQYENTYANAEGKIGSAQQNFNAVQGSSQFAIQQAQNTLQSVTDYFNTVLAQYQQGFQQLQNTASQAEAKQQSAIGITQEEASTQFAGTGTTINIFGVNSSDATAIGNEVSWAARTALAPA